MKRKKKVLFILKKRNAYGNTQRSSYGLKSSCTFISNFLDYKGYDSSVIEIVDSNSIDREVYNRKPNIVILEAIWCPPYKIKELLKLHKKVKWNIRLHSKFPFLAQEKMAMEWLGEYNEIAQQYPNLTISANNEDFINQINNIGFNLIYTPNYYPISHFSEVNTKPVGHILDIGCFGALRILKNTVQQAVCSIKYANDIGKKLKFHINDSSQYEKEGVSILNNLKNIFSNGPHELVIHDWHDHRNFIDLIRKMDLCMQVSFSESYNITAADGIACGIPTIGSTEIEFISRIYKTAPTDYENILNKISFALRYKTLGLHYINQLLLKRNSIRAGNVWLDLID